MRLISLRPGLLGLDRASIIGRPLSRYVLKEDADIFFLTLRQVFETQNRQTWELRMATKNGDLFRAQLESIAVKDQDGIGARARIILSDITARKRAEDSLRESEERFRGMFESHSAVMLLIEPVTGRILDANIAAERFTDTIFLSLTQCLSGTSTSCLLTW